MEKIILFQVEEPGEIEKLAANMRIRLVYAKQEDYSETIENIAAERTNLLMERYSGQPLPGSLMVFCDVTDKHLNKLLFELRTRQVKVDYKAVLTPVNNKWTVLQLYRELERERAALESVSMRNRN